LFLALYIFGQLVRWVPARRHLVGFSKLLISPAYAQDNFELIPSVADSLGVETNSVYILKSKEPLNTALIKDHLEIIPEFDYKLKEISDTEWQIVPEGLVEPNTIVRVALATSYIDEVGKQQERDYSWAFQIKDNFKVLHSIPRDTGTQVPTNTGIEITFSHDNFKDFEKYFMLVDLQAWLTNESLMRTDKMTMAFGLEERVPLLDHRLVELAVKIPSKYKLKRRREIYF